MSSSVIKFDKLEVDGKKVAFSYSPQYDVLGITFFDNDGNQYDVQFKSNAIVYYKNGVHVWTNY